MEGSSQRRMLTVSRCQNMTFSLRRHSWLGLPCPGLRYGASKTQETLVLKMKCLRLGKLIAHNAALYQPTLRQLSSGEVLTRALARPMWSPESWRLWHSIVRVYCTGTDTSEFTEGMSVSRTNHHKQQRTCCEGLQFYQ